MLDALELRDYKSYRASTEIPLRRLTILLGKNNSGKTSIARFPLQMLTALSGNTGLSRDPLPLVCRGLVYGGQVADLVYRQSSHGTLGVGLRWADTPSSPANLVRADVQLVQTLDAGQRAVVSRFEATPDVGSISWSGGRGAEDVAYMDPRVAGFRGLFPVANDPTSFPELEPLRRRLEDELERYLHLGSVRAPIRPVYERRLVSAATEPSGSEAPFILHEYEPISRAVRTWYEQHLGASGFTVGSDASSFSLEFRHGPTAHNLSRGGQGIQQVLPVITYLKGVAEGLLPYRTVVIEEPELHLHPAAHGGVASAIVDAVVRCSDLQVIVETHSENLVLRVRRAVAAGELDPDTVNILWSERDSDGATSVREVFVRRDGSVSEWPAGVFSEDLEEVRAIAQAGAGDA